MTAFVAEKPKDAVPIYFLTPETLDAWLEKQVYFTRVWIDQLGFKAKPGQTCLVPGNKGLKAVLLGQDENVEARWSLARLGKQLTSGTFYLADRIKADLVNGLCLSWALSSYTYRSKPDDQDEEAPSLVWPKNADPAYVRAAAKAYFLVRTLVSAPTNHMGPAELSAAAERLNPDQFHLTVGDDLIAQSFPAIHAVGRAANEPNRSPRLIDMRWGATGPKVTLVGKGVCFDTGGLDLKGAAFMRLMKKDMGGAAHVLGLASMLVDLKQDIQLRVLIPAVENSVAGNAFRPGDVIDTRKGISVEIGNTDAEGRLVLADALTLAEEDAPDLIIDYATLTGAARVALGPDVPAVFTNNDKLAGLMQSASDHLLDPSWRLPLHQPYAKALATPFADTNNISEGMSQGGAITAALFLQKFVKPETPWMHVDVMAWNTGSKPGRPKGGEAMSMLAAYEAIKGFLDLKDQS